MFVQLEDKIVLIFPLNTAIDTLESFLDHMYPEEGFNYVKHKEYEYLVTNNIKGKIESVILKFSSGNVSLGTNVFQLTREEHYIKLRGVQSRSYIGNNDPCVILANQFNGNTMFNILQYLDEEHQDEYFYALRAIIESDDSTAASKLALVSEFFFFTVIRQTIPTIFKGTKGMGDIRSYINTHDRWSDLMNVLHMIQAKLSMSDDRKTILQTFFHGFHFLRELRNRAQHSTKLLSPYQCISMLSQLTFLTTEVEELIRIKE
ncbi:MAG: hypothetical protein ACFFB5_13840 [Promethearchaeota archaeon]